MIDTEYLETIKDLKIERLALDESIVSGLHEENIYTVGDLLEKSNDEFIGVATRRHFSIRTIAEKLQNILSELTAKNMAGTFHSVLKERVDDDSVASDVVNNETLPGQSDSGSDPDRNHEEQLSLEECVRKILIDRKESGKEWVTMMTIYDVICSEYPLLKETFELVDLREILTKSDWINKDDYYYRLAEETVMQENTKFDLSSAALNDPEFKDVSLIEQTKQISAGDLDLVEIQDEVLTGIDERDEIKEEPLFGPVSQSVASLLDSVPIESLTLSLRGFNCLKRAGVNTVGDLIKYDERELLRIRNLGSSTVQEIITKTKEFIADIEDNYGKGSNNKSATQKVLNNEPIRVIYKGSIIYNIPIEKMGLSARAFNCLNKAGINTLIQLADMKREDLLSIRNMGIGTANEIESVVSQLLREESLRAVTTEDELNEVKSEYYHSESFREQISQLIIKCLNERDFEGTTLHELLIYTSNDEDTDLVESVFRDVLAGMVSNGTIEIDNGRYKRVYPSVLEVINDLSEDHRNIVASRLNGQTLAEIANRNGLTRERIRQIVSKQLQRLHEQHTHFCEDKYKFFFENYSVSKSEWIEWIKEPEYILIYLQTMYMRGNKPLIQAAADGRVDAGIRRKIQAKDDENYIVIGDKRIPKERKEIEDYVIYHYFQDECTVDDFYEQYDEFLRENNIFDKNLYATEDVRRTRENRIADSHKALWKQNRRLRYYDVDGTDLDELFDTLRLEQYENTEISTLKFIRDFPDLMKEYDIRDEYELHNLLKKACDPSRYHSIDFGRMPGIKFGESSRDEMVREMLFRLAPVSQDDLADALSEEYGFRSSSIKANWLDCIDIYFLNGEYHIEDEMNELVTDEQREALKDALSDSFYFIDQVAMIFSRILGQPIKEPSSIVLKSIGFKVFSGYVLKGASSATDYFYKELEGDDIVDHSKYGTRMRQIMAYNVVLNALKEEYAVFEFEPFKFVNLRRLESFGISKADIIRYCTEVKQFVGEDEYFTIPWLRKQGFTSILDDLGFDDFFYEALLAMDPDIYSFINRAGKRKGAALLRVGKEHGSKNDFLISLIDREGSIDREELISLCKNDYGMYFSEHNLLVAIEDSDVYYDSIMEKYYSNYSMYYDEI